MLRAEVSKVRNSNDKDCVIKMKVAVSSTGKEVESEVSNIFGRSPYFIIAEIENGKIVKTEAVENTSAQQMSGAGSSTVQLIAEKDVEAVITGNPGPRASSALIQFNIGVYSGIGCKSVEEALQKFIENKLEKIQ